MTSFRNVWKWFVVLGRPIFQSEIRWRATGLLVLLVSLLLGVSTLNVFNSFVGSYFMTSIARHEMGRFYTFAALYAAGFAVSTVVAVFYRFTEERLGLMWRQWLTNHLTGEFLKDGACERITRHREIDNPDQRLAEDVKSFTTTTLSLLLIVLNSSLTLLAFSGILWSITPWLFFSGAAYAALGSAVAILLGRRLLGLDVRQLKTEADLRYELIQLRDQAAAEGVDGREATWAARVRRRLESVVDNMKHIIAVNRNLGFFTTGYNYMLQIIPILIVAPLYIQGKIEFGQVTQAAMAFGHVLGAFSLIVVEFGRITSFAAVIARLGAMWEALNRKPLEIPGTESAGRIELSPLRLAEEGALASGA